MESLPRRKSRRSGTISAVANELDGDLHLFTFGGDGARFALPPSQAQRVSDVLSRVAVWVRRDLELELRVATMTVSEIRSAGFDIKAAFWKASIHIKYAMFMGDGLDWTENELKSRALNLATKEAVQEPDLTGSLCQ